MNYDEKTPYCTSRFETVRRQSRKVRIGDVEVGGDAPLIVQSMTTTPTQDVKATVAQSIALAEAGCQIVRITAQNVQAAKALFKIRKEFSSAGFSSIPLVADIHFLPNAAMEAVEHVEKVRINPGNYADKKKFQIREYSDSDYTDELDRLHEAFSPIVLRCKDLGRAMRIGTNHGSLSDRIMNRYGDTPLGMCESALEFLRIAESHGFRDIVISMKASNPKVMIQAYRLMVARMAEEDMHYPLHLGVTEAGDGDDARIKSSIGIGSLLLDGLGDTIRVSLTEDPVEEIPVARALVEKIEKLWKTDPQRTLPDPVNPFSFTRRPVEKILLGGNSRIDLLEPPRVIHQPRKIEQLPSLQTELKDARIEGLLNRECHDSSMTDFSISSESNHPRAHLLWDMQSSGFPNESTTDTFFSTSNRILLLSGTPETWSLHTDQLLKLPANRIIATLNPEENSPFHEVGRYRQLQEILHSLNLRFPIWIRCTEKSLIEPDKNWFGSVLLENSILIGSLLCDGIGDLVSVENVEDDQQAVTLAYNILQGSRARTTKTEYVACPSCGRTLFDLQTTTQKIRAATGHLKGVTIAVMGCIVNGPGEMADADFGYVGGAPGKINLYVGKECVRYHIPANEAVESLIDLIREHDKWVDPE